MKEYEATRGKKTENKKMDKWKIILTFAVGNQT